MPRKSDAKEKMIIAASVLFKRHGFNGAGLTEILSVSGAPKGSFYHHFPEGKEQLAEAVLEKEGAVITELISSAFSSADDFESGAIAMSGAIASWFKATDFAEGSPVTSVLLDRVPDSARLHAACKAVFSEWANTVADHATRLGAVDNALRLGEAVVLALEGAWVLSRAERSTTPFYLAAKLMVSIANE